MRRSPAATGAGRTRESGGTGGGRTRLRTGGGMTGAAAMTDTGTAS